MRGVLCFAHRLEIMEEITVTESEFYKNPYYFWITYYIPLRYVTITKATVYYFLPLSIIGLLYSLMARKLHKSAHEIQNSMASRLPTNKNQAKSRRHVARMVIVFILGNKFKGLILLCIFVNIRL